jgi:ATP-dependent DNA helicase RecG
MCIPPYTRSLEIDVTAIILKVSVPKVTEKLIEKSIENGERFTENRIAILRLIAENPYISKSELAESIGISVTAISNNIKAMRNKYLRRVGADKGGFWEVIE